MDWKEELVLPQEVQDFLDAYLEGQVSLPVYEDYGVPVYMGVPSMLLFRIGQSEHTCCSEVKEQVHKAESIAQRSVTVFGVSGCGKTRSLYDLFCERDGFYFVAAAFNGGSYDLELLIEMLERFLSRGQDESLINKIVARVLITLLLACRMKIYLYCKSKDITSRKWLLLQAACRGLARQDGVAQRRDPFCEFFRGVVTKLCVLPREQIASQLEPLLRQVTSTPVPIPTIALDEFQEAMKLYDDGYFWSASSGIYLPLANVLEDACRVDGAHKHVVVVSGTLHFKRDIGAFGSGHGKTRAEAEFMNFRIWNDATEMVNYAQQAIPLGEDEKADLQTMFSVFKGRFRPLASVLEIMILKGFSLREATAYVIVGLTTELGQPGMPKSFYGVVTRLAGQGKVHGVDLLEQLEFAVVKFFAAGRGYVFSGSMHACIALVEAGLGRLELTIMGFNVHLDEYLVLAAARNYFQKQHAANGSLASSYLPSKWLQLKAAVSFPSGQGKCLQNFMALSFESMWEQCGGTMAGMPLLRPLLEASGCPEEFRDWALRKGEVVKGRIDGFVPEGGYDAEAFLVDLERGEPLCTTWISGDNTIAVRGIRYDEDGQAYVMHVLEQHKFPKNELTATATGMFDDSKFLSKIQLRLLVMLPQSKGDQCGCFWELHAGGKRTGYVILDADNAADLFGSGAADELLRQMKRGTALQHEIEERKRNLPPRPERSRKRAKVR